MANWSSGRCVLSSLRRGSGAGAISRRGVSTLLLSLFVLALPVAAAAQVAGPENGASIENRDMAGLPTTRTPLDAQSVPGQIIVKYEDGVRSVEKAAIRRQEGLDKKKELDLIQAEVVGVEGQPVDEAIRDLEGRPNVEYAVRDRLVQPQGYGDEPSFGELWGLNNTGQTVNGVAGSADVDLNALEASEVTQGDPNLVVAVVDDGVDFTHPDLAGRPWTNPGESGTGKENNGIDDVGNGYVDDVNGWDLVGENNTVHDAEDSHGTGVAGTIAASVNNQGIVGWRPTSS